MVKRKLNGVTIKCGEGDVTNQPINAGFNPANAGQRIGGGVAFAMDRAVGPNIEEVNRPGIVGGCFVWVTLPVSALRAWHRSAPRLPPAGCCR
jgi:hypothetical protein